MTLVDTRSNIHTRIRPDTRDPTSGVFPGLALRDGLIVTGMVRHPWQIGVASIIVDAKVPIDGIAIRLGIRDIEADGDVVAVVEGHFGVGPTALRVSRVGREWCSLFNFGVGARQCGVRVDWDCKSCNP